MLALRATVAQVGRCPLQVSLYKTEVRDDGDTHWLLADDHLLDLVHLRHVVGARLKLLTAHALVDAGQQVGVDVLSVVDPCEAQA